MDSLQASRPASIRGNRPTAKPATESAWKAFRAGLFRPSRTALGLTVGLTLGCWALVVFGITPHRMARWAPYFSASVRDTCVFVTGRVLAMQEEFGDGRPGVVFIGASGLRDAITSSSVVEAALAESLDLAPLVRGLVSDGQNLLETSALLQALPEEFEGTIVIGMNPFRLGQGLAVAQEDGSLEYRLGIRTPVLVRESAAAGHRLPDSVSYVWDNLDFFLPRLRYVYRNVRRGKPVELARPGNREGGGKADESAWEWFTEHTRGLPETWRARARPGLLVLARTIAELPNRDRLEVVLLEGPVAPRALREVYGEVFYANYLRMMDGYAAEQGYGHWNLSSAARLEEADFYDWGHLNSAEARERFTAVLVERLAELLEAR